MRFELTTLRDLVWCSNHWVTGDNLWVSTRTARHTASQPSNDWHMNSLTASRCHIIAYQDMQSANLQSEYIKDETTTTWYLT